MGFTTAPLGSLTVFYTVFAQSQRQGLYSPSVKTSYRQISWSIEAARLDVAMVASLWNLTGTSAAALPRYLPNFRAIGKVQTRISRLRDFTRSCGKTSYRLVNRDPGKSALTAGLRKQIVKASNNEWHAEFQWHNKSIYTCLHSKLKRVKSKIFTSNKK